jgi:predicted DsbA family dithiol-disulfide isomerase
MAPLRVEIWSDIACPWCWVGKRQLETAAADFAGELAVSWRAFELDPHAPRDVSRQEPVDYVERLARKYRTGRDAAQAMIDRMEASGAEVGLDFRFDRVRPGNTFDAHRLMALAGARGAQNELAEILFRAYFHDGVAIADRAALLGCGREAGLEPAEIEAMLASDARADEVRGDERLAGEMGVTGVPFFFLEGRYGVAGAQPAEALLAMLNRVSESLGELEGDQGAACGPEGCDRSRRVPVLQQL